MLLVDAGNDFVGIGNTTQWGGVLNVTSSDNGNTLVLACTDTDANAGPLLSLYRSSSSSAADGDILGQINFQGLNDANQAVTYGRIQTFIRDASDGTEDGTVQINHIIAGSEVNALELDNDEYVFNNGSNNVDFRVESDGNANAFFVDAGNNRIGLFSSGPTESITFDGSSSSIFEFRTGTQAMFRPPNNDNDHRIVALTSNGLDIVHGGATSTSMQRWQNQTGVVFNEDSVDQDFRVESNGNANLFKIDANSDSGAGQVICGSATAITGVSAPLAVNGFADTRIAIDGTDSAGLYMTDSNAEPITIRNAGGDLEFYGNAAHEFVFNEDGIDVDFRIESDNSTHAFAIDGTSGGVGFGTSLNSDLHTSATNILLGRAGSLYAERSSALGIPVTAIGYNFYIDSDTGSYAARITDGGSNLAMGDGTFSFNTAASVSAGAAITYVSRMNIGTTSVVINESGADNDFRVESATNENAFKVDAGHGSGGAILFGMGTPDASTAGAYHSFNPSSHTHFVQVNTTSSTNLANIYVNRQSSDGRLIEFRQANTFEGSIEVSGSTVSYDGFAGRHESSGIAADTAKGTVVSTIDELDVYPDTQPDIDTGQQQSSPKAGQTRADHPKVKISDSVGDKRVYGVVDEFSPQGKLLVISVGIGPIKVTGACAGGDLLESNGDGTAKVQSDDVIRSSTIGKVTIGNSDTGVKLVSCVLYCG
jgi:hypothetical protein